ncbi:MAG: nucleoside monophosphate kinase [Pirellulales bacterium]|nr:nucleoside monophosphate kinase [Pirellulales bacterium]
MEAMSQPREALLLLGPSGVGKTPLGELLERRGLAGRSCAHFDFGSQLRRLVAGKTSGDFLSSEELDFLRGVLRSGALLEDRHLPLAMRILRGFLAERQENASLVVLNGFPRHAGQAAAIDSVLRVAAVARMICDKRTILERIARNVGGDRRHRDDDRPADVLARFRLFMERTVRLADHYRTGGAKMIELEVAVTTTPDESYQQLDRLWLDS